MPNLPQVGLDAVIANLPKFEQGAKTITQAYDGINAKADAVGKVTERMGLKFDEASGRWRTAAGQFATNAEVAAAGINKAKSAADNTGKSFIDLGSIAGRAGGQLVGLGSTLLNIGAIAGGAALAGVTALGAGLATFAVTGINKAIDLDAQMATIAATMNTTKDAVGPLKDLILDLALDPNLTVNTTQAADAIQLLAQNGATADQIMGGLAKSTVALANATGAQFSTAADVASGILKVFNLDVKDMGQAIDGITGVVNQSKFTIDDYAQAFAQAGSVAAGMGVNLQDFNTVIAATANSFTSGSDAGTSFKTLLQRLANPTDEVRAVTEKYGISLFDAAGNMRPLAEVAGQLNTVLQGTATITSTVGGATKKMTAAAEAAQKAIPNLTTSIGQQEAKLKILQDELGAIAFHYGADSLRARKAQLAIDNLTISIDQNKTKLSDYQGAIAAVSVAQEQQVTSTKKLTEAEKAELAAVIGGADAARIVLALSQVTASEFDNLSGSVNDVGQAFRAAATRVDSVQGSFDIFKGIVEAVQIQVGDKFLPILRRVTVGFTDLASKYGPMAVDFFGQVADTITTLIDRGTELFNAFQSGGVFGEGGLLAALGISPDIITTIQTTLDSITEKVNAFMTGGLFGTMKETPGGMQETGGLLRALGINEDFPAILENWAGQVIAAIPGILTQILSSIATFATENWPIISDALASWTTKFWDWAKNAAAGAGTAMSVFGIALLAWAFSPEAQESMSTLGHTLGVMLTDAIKRNFEGGEGASNVLVSLATGLLTAVGSIFGTLIILGGQIVAGILSGILESFGISLQPTTFSNLSVILTNIGNDIKTIAKTIGTKIVTSIKTGWDNTVATITTAFQTGVDSWMTIVTETKWLELGASIIEGIQKGITDNAGKVLEQLKSLMGDFLQGAASAIGYNTPAKKFIPLGASIPEGIAVGMGQGAGSVTAAMGEITQATLDSLLGVQRNVVSVSGAIGQARDTVEKFLETTIDDNKTKRALKIMGQVFRDNSEIILGASNRVAKFQELLGNVNFGVNNQQQNAIMGSVGIWLSEFDKNLAAMKAAQKQIFIEAGRTALTIGSKLNDIVSSSADILDQRVKTLQELMDSGLAEVNFDGQIMSAVQAQELLNIALAEQREIQDDILQLKQNEQKLTFLEKQLSLVETLNEAGLDVNDILGGISLGLDASIPDMIAATNKLVMAMIEQVNQDLQIASPSKVMAKKGLFAGEGFAEGILASIPDVMGAMKRAIIGPSMVSGPALSGGGNSRVTNNNFSMSVNSGASPQAVMQQFEIARAMA